MKARRRLSRPRRRLAATSINLGGRAGLCSLLRRLCLRLTVQEPTFREVVVLYDEVGNTGAEDAAEEEACGGLRLKSFRDIPIADVEVVFPGLRVERIRSADGIKIGFILLAGVATALYSFYVSRGDNLTVTATLITLLVWRMIMTWYYIISAKWGMDKFIQTTLYHRSQDSKKGVLLYVVNSIETHELRECLLLYALLLRTPPTPPRRRPPPPPPRPPTGRRRTRRTRPPPPPPPPPSSRRPPPPRPPPTAPTTAPPPARAPPTPSGCAPTSSTASLACRRASTPRQPSNASSASASSSPPAAAATRPSRCRGCFSPSAPRGAASSHSSRASWRRRPRGGWAPPRGEKGAALEAHLADDAHEPQPLGVGSVQLRGRVRRVLVAGVA